MYDAERKTVVQIEPPRLLVELLHTNNNDG